MTRTTTSHLPATHSPRSQSGQIGIIIILIMVVLLTIGLSLANRATREVFLSSQEQATTRVFNAAEAGVEQALATDLSFQGEEYHPAATTIPGTDSTVDYVIKKVRVLETLIFQGVSAKVLVSDGSAPPPAQLNIDWSKETDCATQVPASLVVSVYSQDASTPPIVTVRHYAFAACNHNDGVTVAGAGSNGYYKRVTIPLQISDRFVRIKPVYNDTNLRVSPSSGTLPVQYYNIRSSATNVNGDENRVVEVNQTLPTAPSIFDYVLFSGGNLEK